MVPSDERARELVRCYFELEGLYARSVPFGGPLMPKLVRVRGKVRQRLLAWCGFRERVPADAR